MGTHVLRRDAGDAGFGEEQPFVAEVRNAVHAGRACARDALRDAEHGLAVCIRPRAAEEDRCVGAVGRFEDRLILVDTPVAHDGIGVAADVGKRRVRDICRVRPIIRRVNLAVPVDVGLIRMTGEENAFAHVAAEPVACGEPAFADGVGVSFDGRGEGDFHGILAGDRRFCRGGRKFDLSCCQVNGIRAGFLHGSIDLDFGNAGNRGGVKLVIFGGAVCLKRVPALRREQVDAFQRLAAACRRCAECGQRGICDGGDVCDGLSVIDKVFAAGENPEFPGAGKRCAAGVCVCAGQRGQRFRSRVPACPLVQLCPDVDESNLAG